MDKYTPEQLADAEKRGGTVELLVRLDALEKAIHPETLDKTMNDYFQSKRQTPPPIPPHTNTESAS